MAEDTTPTDEPRATSYVRPENLQPAGPNPFDNGTAEPAPPLGQPNGVPLEDVLAVTPPEVYEQPAGPVDAVTAKASPEERAKADAANIEADRAAAAKLEEAGTLASTPATLDEAPAAKRASRTPRSKS